LSTGSTGIGHACNSPDGRYAMITSYGNNVVTVVDFETLTPVKDLTIGSGRMGDVAFTQDTDVGEGWCLNVSAGIQDEQRSLARDKTAARLITEIHIAGRIHNVQDVILAVLLLIIQAHDFRSNGYAGLFLDIRIIEHLRV
jgi:hypothetical protein